MARKRLKDHTNRGMTRRRRNNKPKKARIVQIDEKKKAEVKKG